MYSMEDISKVNLAKKITFLKEHGFDYFEEVCAKDIRNAIAHQNIEIKDDGTLIIKEGQYSLNELDKISRNTDGFLLDILKIIADNTA